MTQLEFDEIVFLSFLHISFVNNVSLSIKNLLGK